MAGLVDGDDLALDAVHRFPNGVVERRRPPPLGPHRARRRGRHGPGGCSPRIPDAGVDRHRHVGRRLRPPRRRRAAPGRAHRLPRRPHGRRHRRGARPRLPRRAVRDQRAPVPAVQHALPARRRAAGPALGPSGPRRAPARPPRPPAHRRAAHRGHERVDHRPPRRPHRRVVRRAARPARHPRRLLPPLEPPGAVRGRAPGRRARSRPSGSHDTASAVVGVPATTERFAYVASGTWSLVGLELAGPVLTDEARAANFTNERRRRRPHPLPAQRRRPVAAPGVRCGPGRGRTSLALLDEAAAVPAGGPVIDVDDAGSSRRAACPSGSRRRPDGRR